MDNIKNHPWFRNINWEQLYDKDVVPPFEPDVSWPSHGAVRQARFRLLMPNSVEACQF